VCGLEHSQNTAYVLLCSFSSVFQVSPSRNMELLSFSSSSHENGEIFQNYVRQHCTYLVLFFQTQQHIVSCAVPKHKAYRNMCEVERSSKASPGLPYVLFLSFRTHQRDIACTIPNQIFYLAMCKPGFFPSDIMAQQDSCRAPWEKVENFLKASMQDMDVSCLFCRDWNSGPRNDMEGVFQSSQLSQPCALCFSSRSPGRGRCAVSITRSFRYEKNRDSSKIPH
jgi:hypothetical protein